MRGGLNMDAIIATLFVTVCFGIPGAAVLFFIQRAGVAYLEHSAEELRKK